MSILDRGRYTAATSSGRGVPTEPSALVLNLSPLALIGSLSIQYDLDKEGEGPYENRGTYFMVNSLW